jgi:hypothetical protein
MKATVRVQEIRDSTASRFPLPRLISRRNHKSKLGAAPNRMMRVLQRETNRPRRCTARATNGVSAGVRLGTKHLRSTGTEGDKRDNKRENFQCQ